MSDRNSARTRQKDPLRPSSVSPKIGRKLSLLWLSTLRSLGFAVPKIHTTYQVRFAGGTCASGTNIK
ncbi:hypothetical protein KIN_43090 [Litoreibacter roseus]|uniref:Uncharacterized protein n=1 Tax=Litoreibacter roseus TaxID=2601869 RepID=A0A6N6JMB0_9RHOB|nr:hypothetical protein KIN_43090 [Litoreibacter roseus]